MEEEEEKRRAESNEGAGEREKTSMAKRQRLAGKRVLERAPSQDLPKLPNSLPPIPPSRLPWPGMVVPVLPVA